jgi:hypothetical protein
MRIEFLFRDKSKSLTVNRVQSASIDLGMLDDRQGLMNTWWQNAPQFDVAAPL